MSKIFPSRAGPKACNVNWASTRIKIWILTPIASWNHLWYINLDLATLEKSVDLIFGFVMASGPYMANLGSPSYIFPCTAHFFSNNAPSEIGHLLSSRQFISPGKTNIWMRYEQILQMDLWEKLKNIQFNPFWPFLQVHFSIYGHI